MSTIQLEFFDIPSPCVGICQSDQKGLCIGCMRTRDERRQWLTFSTDDKQKVIKRCQQRKKRKENAGKPKVEEMVVIEEPKNIQPSLLDKPEKTTVQHSQDLDFGDFEL